MSLVPTKEEIKDRNQHILAKQLNSSTLTLSGEPWAKAKAPDHSTKPDPWICPVCGRKELPLWNIWDGIWIVNQPDPCPGCEAVALGQKLLAEHREWLIKEYGFLDEDGIYGHMRFNTYIPDPRYSSQQQAREKALAVLSEWKNGNWGKGLMLWSPNVGVGKTHLAVALVYEGMMVYPRGTQNILTIWDMPSYVREVKASYDNGGTEAIIQSAIRPAILLLDDLGAEYAKAREWYQNLVYDIVNARWVKQKATVVTSNLDPMALATHIGMRASSRLLALTGKPHKMDGEDYRRRSLIS